MNSRDQQQEEVEEEMETFTVKDSKSGWTKSYQLKPSAVSQLAFKTMVSEDCGIPLNELRILCGGKFLLNDELTLRESSIRANCKILAFRKPPATLSETETTSLSSVVGTSSHHDERITCEPNTLSEQPQQQVKTKLQEEEEKIKRLQRIRTLAEEMANRQGGGYGAYEKQHFVLENQNGERVKLPQKEQRSLVIGLCLHQIGQDYLKKKEYRDAYECFNMADEEWRSVNPQIMATVDNYANLNIDLVWAMFHLNDSSLLTNSAQRLAIAQQLLTNSHGPNMERLLQIRKGYTPELAVYARLHLLQAIVAFHTNQRQEAQRLLWKTEFEIKSLTIDPQMIENLVVMGFSAKEAKIALRASNKNIDNAVNYILEQREAKRKRIEEERKRKAERREQVKIGKTLNGQFVNISILNSLVTMGYDRDIAAEALKRTNNAQDTAIVLITNQMDMLEGAVESRIHLRYSNPNLVRELMSMGFDLQRSHFALKKTNNNLEQSINLLIEGKINPRIEQAYLYDPTAPAVVSSSSVDDDIYGDGDTQMSESQDSAPSQSMATWTSPVGTSNHQPQQTSTLQNHTTRNEEDELEDMIYDEISSKMSNEADQDEIDLTVEREVLQMYMAKLQ